VPRYAGTYVTGLLGGKVYPLALWYGVGSVTPIFDRGRYERDLKVIREAGIRFLRLWINWRDCEPSPGTYRFDTLGELMELSRKVGLRVIAQVYLEFAPDWLPRMFPDAIFTSESGTKLHPQGSPGICLDSRAARDRAGRFLRALAEFMKGYENFYAWDVWSEPQTVQWVFQLGQRRPLYCYCDHTVERFRVWLKGLYGSIDELNKAWHRSYSSFDEVEPPRFVVLHYARDNIDWVEFNVQKLKEDLKWRAEIVKSVDPYHPVTSHAATTSLFLNPLYGHPDDWEMAGTVDVWGTSLYPKHAHRVPDPVVDGFILDAVRSSAQSHGKDFWLGELQGGQGVGGLRLAEPVTPDDVALWIWQSFAHGAKGICVYHSYPMLWGYESSGYGILDPDGSPTDRFRALSNVAKFFEDYEGLFAEARPLKAECAILYNRYVYRLLWVLQEDSARVPSASALGIYRMFFKHNIPVDMLSSRQLEEGSCNYKVLIAPFSISISESMARGLRSFVSGGGFLLVDARFGWFKEDGWVDSEIPAYSLRDLLGAREESCRSLAAEGAAMKVVAEGIPGLQVGDTIRAWQYLETLRIVDSSVRVVATSDGGSPALSMKNFGAGLAVWAGTSLGLSYENTRDPGAEKLVLGVAKAANVEPPIVVDPPGSLEVRLLSLGSEKLVVVINHGTSEARARLRTSSSLNIARFKDLITGSTYVAESGVFTLSVQPRKVIVGYSEP
jgi:beta-galactosidase